MGRAGRDLADPGYGQVASCYEVGNEHANCIKCEKCVV